MASIYVKAGLSTVPTGLLSHICHIRTCYKVAHFFNFNIKYAYINHLLMRIRPLKRTPSRWPRTNNGRSTNDGHGTRIQLSTIWIAPKYPEYDQKGTS